MIIKKLHLENFKCFKNFDAEFSEGINLIIGVNGSGKTSILEGLSIAAGSLWIQLSEINKRGIDSDEIRVEPQLGLPQFQFPVVVKATGDVMGQEDVIWSRELNSISGGPTMINAKPIVELSKKVGQDVQNGVKTILPIMAYFSCSRLAKDRKLPSKDKSPIGRFLGYYNALNDTSIKKFIEMWFSDTERWVLQRTQAGVEVPKEDFEWQSIELIREVVKTLPIEKEQMFFFDPYIDDKQTSHPAGLYFVGKDKTVLHESFLSDGQRNLLWLFIEITWRALNLNPFLGKKANEETNGIVLIDEIDLFLHPGWQQKIIQLLESTFPKIQFILTTHSPIVISSVKKVLILDHSEMSQPSETPFGKEPAFVLKKFMGTGERLPGVQLKLDQYFGLINLGEGQSEPALKLRRELESGDDSPLGLDDPAFAEADVLISLFN